MFLLDFLKTCNSTPQRAERKDIVQQHKEFSIQAVVLGIILAVALGAANAYLAAYASMTVSASIPAAVMSMLIFAALRRRADVLEHNIVQTIASAGESAAAGLIFTIPALLITKVWGVVEYWPTFFICLLGGLLGVIFMIPLRRTIVVGMRDRLRFPEGKACAVILRSTSAAAGKRIMMGAAIGAAFKVCVGALALIRETIGAGFKIGKGVGGVGMDMSVELTAVGVYIGFNASFLMFLGGAMVFLFGIPIWTNLHDWSGYLQAAEGNLYDAAMVTWSKQARFIGVGAMAIAGLYSIWNLWGPMMETVRTMLRRTDSATAVTPVRTEQDLSPSTIKVVGGVLMAAILVFYGVMTGHWGIALVVGTLMVILGFFFTAVASYIAGLVGSSNSPVSGMTLCALLVTGVAVFAFDLPAASAIAATLVVAGIVCSAASMSGDMAQDLATGREVGATPRLQQIGEVIGVVASAAVLPLVLRALDSAYGLGHVVHDGVKPLKCAQGQLFAAVTSAFAGQGALNMRLVTAGAAIGAAFAILDTILKARQAKFHTHPMALAVGMYLPWSMSVPILTGALIGMFARSVFVGKGQEEAEQRGTLTAAGLIVGGSLTGVLIAVPILLGIKLPITVLPEKFAYGNLLSAVAMGLLLVFIVRTIRRPDKA